MQAAISGGIKNFLPRGIMHNRDSMHIARYKPFSFKLPGVAAIQAAIHATDFDHSPNRVRLKWVKQYLCDPRRAHIDL